MSPARRVMLDTNEVSAMLKSPSAVFQGHLIAAPASALCVSAITEGELRFGLAKRPDAHRLANAVEALLARVDILPWESAAAARYGVIRASLERAGTPLANLDTLIAAHALSVGAALVTRDKAFTRVEGLTTMDWDAEG